MASAILSSLTHPDEIVELIKYGLNKEDPTEFYRHIENCPPKDDEKYIDFMCYYLLGKTSRSFARVIQELTSELKDAVCVFYLVLRGLDTIEDDMTIELNEKVELLRNFHTYSYKKGWTYSGNGPNEKDRILLLQYDVVIEKYLKLKPSYQKIIEHICEEMGKGMSEFCINEKPSTIENYYLYTYTVAGLVGVGLSQLFSESKLEDPDLKDKIALSDSMGRFLQKTNIIRDFLEDYEDGRKFWPDEVWKKFVPDNSSTDIGVLLLRKNMSSSMATLNYLCIDAFQHVIDCLEYLSLLKEKSVFSFCAIPQLMAVSTLALVFNNPDIFGKKGVKTRKGEAVKIMRNTNNISDAAVTFINYIKIIEDKAESIRYNPLEKENYKKLTEYIKQIRIWTQKNSDKLNIKQKMQSTQRYEIMVEMISTTIFLILTAIISYIIFYGLQ